MDNHSIQNTSVHFITPTAVGPTHLKKYGVLMVLYLEGGEEEK